MQQMFLENRTDEAYVEEFRSASHDQPNVEHESVMTRLFKGIWYQALKLGSTHVDTKPSITTL